MAGLELLQSMIYHEKQQPGSMLCAQHALNNLFQENLFSAPDLSAIAHRLDQLEAAYDEDRQGRASTNMDDTGFFSVQVLEDALRVWGLALVRWRSEAMRPYNNRPHTQLAFVLHLDQHWLTLRRFGLASANIDEDEGNGHWFNLNSFLDAPQWVSKTYLGMVLQQMEAEGYSVFAVVPIDPDAPLTLTRTQADLIASTTPEPTSASAPSASAYRTPGPATTGGSASAAGRPIVTGSGSGQDFDIADEDMELQAALQASLVGGTADELLVPEPGQPRASSATQAAFGLPPGAVFGSGEAPRGRFVAPVDDDDEEEDAEYVPPGAFEAIARARARAAEAARAEVEAPPDPVAASMARNRALLERMRAEQEAALREQYAAEVARADQRHAARARGQPDEDDEDEQLRRAIEESRAMHPPDDEDAMDVAGVAPRIPEERTPTRPGTQHRVYDDEDEELQAALRASLETAPAGYRHPETPPRTAAALPPQPVAAPQAQASASQAITPAPVPAAPQRQPSVASVDSSYETESEAGEEAPPPPQPQESVEEMRRKRLARFGG